MRGGEAVATPVLARLQPRGDKKTLLLLVLPLLPVYCVRACVCVVYVCGVSVGKAPSIIGSCRWRLHLLPNAPVPKAPSH